MTSSLHIGNDVIVNVLTRPDEAGVEPGVVTMGYQQGSDTVLMRLVHIQKPTALMAGGGRGREGRGGIRGKMNEWEDGEGGVKKMEAGKGETF